MSNYTSLVQALFVAWANLSPSIFSCSDHAFILSISLPDKSSKHCTFFVIKVFLLPLDTCSNTPWGLFKFTKQSKVIDLAFKALCNLNLPFQLYLPYSSKSGVIKLSLGPVFVNHVLLEQSHAHSFTCYLWRLLCGGAEWLC